MKQTSNTLAERAVLMRFSAGLPGEHRKDRKLTAEVQSEKAMATDSGRWVKNLYPEPALKAIKAKETEARNYHDSVTLPFGCKRDGDGVDAIGGIGVLPGVLIMEYGDRMRLFRGQLEKLVDDFLANPQEWVDWAIKAHNGTFDPDNYPGCKENDPLVVAMGEPQYVLDADEFRRVMRKRFYLRTEPLPVPNSSHFEGAIRQMLGSDAESVEVRIADAETEAKREVIRRMIAPVKAMAEKLAEQPKVGKDGKCKEDIIFRDTLVQNIKDIVALAPKLNITGCPEIDAFCQEMSKLVVHDADTLRDDKTTRAAVATDAAAMLKRLEGYKF